MSDENNKPQPYRVSTVINEDEAGRLCQTGEWTTDLEVFDRIHHESEKISEGFSDWSFCSQGIETRVLKDFFTACTENLSESVESKHIEQTFDPPLVQFRIKPGTVFKVKSTSLDLGINGLSLILSIFSSTTWPFFFPTWLGLSVIVIVRTLYKGWESIRDPDEKSIFEAIFRHQGRACVVNYDALQEKHYDEAYGFVSPSVNDILAEIGHEITERETRKALSSLESRCIVEERDGRWSITF